MREIVFDTETTGLDPISGDRLVEIGCIELINRFPTGKVFHKYLNPERDMPEPAFKVHGLSIEFLNDKPLFAEVADELAMFIGDDGMLVAHNAMFDLGFLNAELKRAGKKEVNRDRLVDTLMLARRASGRVEPARRSVPALQGRQLTPRQARRSARRRIARRGLSRADRRAPGDARAYRSDERQPCARRRGVGHGAAAAVATARHRRGARRASRVRQDIGRRGDMATVCAGGKAARRFPLPRLEPAGQAAGGADC